MDITPRKIRPEEMGVVHRTAADPIFNPGRRIEIKYRDLGLETATGGDMPLSLMQSARQVSEI